ncbi:hypothetical protein HH1059_09410 [Halorhodospira halochloris]|uniref:Uncharacterized protein n=1 Tax=Halorhodospira halochloris TaxID=1052 RepID=A0A0X8X8X4_HALHR|nr:hypothetical protein [Halorhodospira halochloris]BAU57635.1 hypothetical protein HH1059_09410 [Halorhodospira halochloris]
MSQATAQRLTALGLLAAALFNYPLLSLFATTHMPGGIPLLVGYLFIIWAAIIIATWLIHRSSHNSNNSSQGG